MLGAVTGLLDRAVDVFTVVVGLGCTWLGCRAVVRPQGPHRPPAPVRGPAWVVRVWGIGFVVLGISLAIETVTLMAGGEPGRAGDVIRWVAGPLVVGAIVAAFTARWWERHRTRAAKGGRRA
ncbi:hypothetical protein [Streptomyces sudanensis]|uniref:hypothetical protein n=1 Tax=Streptomyces sudanensis TaxID=436397 RepID=UPI0020CCAC77|nr:hypothetical protein [Streptomyces sudanensis]MCP9956869.1 hypothetical protein [Streptomyces sudanensis]MCQ0002551.1 hypothetical protein [Streptomyces sudanensis]